MADEEYCTYSPVKLDTQVLRLARAAAALADKTLQEWLSDLANDAAAKQLRLMPVKRRPPKPRGE